MDRELNRDQGANRIITNTDGEKKVELQEGDAWDKLGYSFPTWRKWQILLVVFAIQISINMNAAMYSHAVGAVHEKFRVSEQVARIPQMAFLVAYGFACEFWAPWSEEYGRWKVQQLSLFLINIWQIPCALAPNYATMLVARLLGGLSTAGGSVTLGVLADMWVPDEQEYAVAFLVLSSVGGSVVGTIAGSFIEEYLSMEWIFWILLIVGGVVQAIHFFCNPETRATILLDREAKRRRETGEDPNVYGPNEMRGGHKMTMKEFWTIFFRYGIGSAEMILNKSNVVHLGIFANISIGLSTCSSQNLSSFGSRFCPASATPSSSRSSSPSNPSTSNGASAP
jgi:MFS family permease